MKDTYEIIPFKTCVNDANLVEQQKMTFLKAYE